MKRLHALVPLAALLAGIVTVPVDAKTVAFPLEAAGPVVARRPDHDPALGEQIAQTPQGDIAYYRFGHGSPIVLQTGFRATLSGMGRGLSRGPREAS